MILWKWKVQRQNLCKKTPTILNLILLEYKISIFLERPSWSGDFQQNANKVEFILKIVYIKTLAENLTL